jgi:hypothetical protein
MGSSALSFGGLGVVVGATLVGALRSAGCFAGDGIVAGAVVVVVGTVAVVTTGAVRRIGSFACIRAACSRSYFWRTNR